MRDLQTIDRKVSNESNHTSTSSNQGGAGFVPLHAFLDWFANAHTASPRFLDSIGITPFDRFLDLDIPSLSSVPVKHRLKVSGFIVPAKCNIFSEVTVGGICRGSGRASCLDGKQGRAVKYHLGAFSPLARDNHVIVGTEATKHCEADIRGFGVLLNQERDSFACSTRCRG